ncbi:MAG: hypothetical protein AB8B83_01555 [Bdellovibrionales bacterium]
MQSAHANRTSTFGCRFVSDQETDDSIDIINEHTTEEFKAQRVWMISVFWEDNLLPALMLMADQLTAVAVKQTEIVGGFFDAKHQMETQQTLQRITAQAHKNYHPEVGMCEFGSAIKSLAASERQGEVNAVIMAQRSMDRALGNANTAGASGKLSDSRSRLKQFREVYCNVKDNNSGLDFMCEHDQDQSFAAGDIGNPAPGGVGGVDPKRFNKDIDFARTLDAPWTLDVNLTDGSTDVTADEQDIFALAANLYSRDVFTRPQGEDLTSDGTTLTPLQQGYMDARAVIAKRSVAEDSYNALVGMKSSGTEGSRDFLEAILTELGIDDDPATPVNVHVGDSSGSPRTFPTEDMSQLDALLGDMPSSPGTVNPSYYAQMEILTKKIYQNPDFYTNLYTTPANVERKGVALQAIGLMQKFDMLKSHLRTEATQSVLLELSIVELQKIIEEQVSRQVQGGPSDG